MLSVDRRLASLERGKFGNCTCQGAEITFYTRYREPDGFWHRLPEDGVIRIERRTCPLHGREQVLVSNYTPCRIEFVDV